MFKDKSGKSPLFYPDKSVFISLFYPDKNVFDSYIQNFKTKQAFAK